jgi:hypothetical protein
LAHGIDRDGECEFAVIDTHAPFIEQQLLDLLQQSTLVSMENEATIVGDFDQNVFGFQSSHRSCDHHALVCAVDLDRNILLLHLFLYALHLSWLKRFFSPSLAFFRHGAGLRPAPIFL